MKFFLILFFLSALMLSLGGPFDSRTGKPSPSKSNVMGSLPIKSGILNSFERTRNGTLFWAFLSGDKAQVSPKLKKNFDLLELGFLFSPSGLHLSAFLLLLFFIFKKAFSKRASSRLRLLCYVLFYAFPSFAIKRIVILRLLVFLKQRLKKTWSIEKIFLAAFAVSFLLGHYFQSPLGFIMSFLFMGTFISLRDYSRPTMLLGLFTAHMLLSFFTGNEVSPLALILNLPILTFFSAMMSLSGLYLVTYKLVQFNWMERLIEYFLWIIKKSAKLTIGTHFNASLFLILGLWIILLKKDKRWLLLCFFLHTNLANSPAVFVT